MQVRILRGPGRRCVMGWSMHQQGTRGKSRGPVTIGKGKVMAALIARQVFEFISEFDYYGMLAECASEAQAEAEVADVLSKDPAAVIAYLETFEMPAADNLVEKIVAFS